MTQSMDKQQASQRRTPGQWQPQKAIWWTWSVFVLQVCNYSPDSQGIIMWAPSLSDRGGWVEKMKMGDITRRSKRRGTVLKLKRNKERRVSFCALSLSCSNLFLLICLFLSLFFFSDLSTFPSLSLLDIGLSASLSLVPLWQCSRPLRAITIWNDKMEIITMSQDQVEWNGPWKKPTYASVQLCVGSAVLLTVYDICPPHYAVYRSLWVHHYPPQQISQGQCTVTERGSPCSSHFPIAITPNVCDRRCISLVVMSAFY